MAPSITDVEGIKVGTAQDRDALTGCTVVLIEAGATCGVEVRGGAPGTRETDMLDPVNTVDKVHAVLLTGGSAYGLGAAQGVMRYLEEKGVGLFTGKTVVPLVPGAVLFDLNVGDPRVRPDENMGYQAARDAKKEVPEGNWGAGTGATVGKIRGCDYCTKSGQGTWAVSLPGGLVVGVLAAVNAFGDVVNPRTGEIIAGVRKDEGGFASTVQIMKDMAALKNVAWGENTTLAVVATNAVLTKAQAKKVAMMAHNALARTIVPAHTAWDGDTIFVLATGEITADFNLVGVMAQEALMEAVIRAIEKAESAAGIPCAKDVKK